jgi:hypothetical protein
VDCVGARREDVLATGEVDVVLVLVFRLDALLVCPHHRLHWCCSHHSYRRRYCCHYWSQRGVVRC